MNKQANDMDEKIDRELIEKLEKITVGEFSDIVKIDRIRKFINKNIEMLFDAYASLRVNSDGNIATIMPSEPLEEISLWCNCPSEIQKDSDGSYSYGRIDRNGNHSCCDTCNDYPVILAHLAMHHGKELKLTRDMIFRMVKHHED